MGVINRLGGAGHGPVARWDPAVREEVREAERVFREHIAPARELQRVAGHELANAPLVADRPAYAMFDISDGSQPGTQMKEFDPLAEEILAVPQLVGG